MTGGAAGLLLGILGIEVEYAVVPRLSIYVAPKLTVLDGTAIGVDVGAHFFVRGAGIAGLWVGPQVSLNDWLSTALVRQVSVDWGVGALAGYTWVLGSRFVMSLGGGLSYVAQTVVGSDGMPGLYRGVYPAVRFTLGVGL